MRARFFYFTYFALHFVRFKIAASAFYFVFENVSRSR